jgi:polyhydroxybutyrate depolymerase
MMRAIFGHSVTRVAVVIAAVAVAFTGCSSSPTIGATGSVAPGALTVAIAPGAPTPSVGCNQPQTGPLTNHRQNIEVGETSRWYLLNTPAPGTPSPTTGKTNTGESATPRPLVVDFHGLDEGAIIHSATSMFGALGKKDGFVAVFPNGTGNPVQWNTTDQAPSNPDLEFVAAMLDQVESTECIDTSRVYASGFSDGSFMVSLVACTMSNRFAAIAAVSGLQLPTPCHTTRRVPVLAFHGTADPILYFNGGLGAATLHRVLSGGAPSGSSPTATVPDKVNLHGPGYPATVQAWAVKDGCNPKSTDTRISSQVIRRTYQCPAGTGVEFFIILGGGHAWPGSTVSRSISSLTGFTTFQINATDQIWTFFQRFRL